MPERPEMILLGHVDSGPRSGFVQLWSMNADAVDARFDTLLLEHGDDTAGHFGGKGGLRLDDVVAASEPAPAVSGSEAQRQHNNGIDWGGTSAAQQADGR